jgi:hypothetical protein
VSLFVGQRPGLAAFAWWMIPAIERHTVLFRLVCVAVMAAELLFVTLIPWQCAVALPARQ